MHKLSAILVALVSCASGHTTFNWNSPNHLHPVQGLYVKPSDDGTTGDLYVAATEESGVKTKWLTEQPINFLPAGSHPAAHPFYSSSLTAGLPHDETVVAMQKRAVLTSPALKYTYTLPGGSSEGHVPYPYAAIPAPSAEAPTECADPAAASYAQYSPFQYYYPQMMASFTKAMTALKETGISDDVASSIMSHAAPMWPSSYPYPYPVQYVMVDPATWAQSQPAAAPAVPTTTPSSAAESEESA